jgi:hypothetical protein
VVGGGLSDGEEDALLAGREIDLRHHRRSRRIRVVREERVAVASVQAEKSPLAIGGHRQVDQGLLLDLGSVENVNATVPEADQRRTVGPRHDDRREAEIVSHHLVRKPTKFGSGSVVVVGAVVEVVGTVVDVVGVSVVDVVDASVVVVVTGSPPCGTQAATNSAERRRNRRTIRDRRVLPPPPYRTPRATGHLSRTQAAFSAARQDAAWRGWGGTDGWASRSSSDSPAPTTRTASCGGSSSGCGVVVPCRSNRDDGSSNCSRWDQPTP